MREFLSRVFNAESVPYGSKLITLVTSIRWAGWGFAETLIPVFVYSFGSSYVEAGLLKSAYDVAFILALPLIGLIADSVSATRLLSIGLVLYLFVGFGYFIAGATGIVLLIVLTRFLNGFSYAIDTVGRETYFRRHSPPEKLATVFGYFDTVANFWWVVTACLGIVLINYFSIHTLLFLITPATFIGLIILVRYRLRKHPENQPDKNKRTKIKEALRGMKLWGWELRSLVTFNFFITAASASVAFFIPIETYVEGGNLTEVILLGIVFAIPSLFGWTFGRWFDTKGSSLFTYGLFTFSTFLVSLAFVDLYLWKIVAVFAIGSIVELLSVGSDELITTYADPEHFGRTGGLAQSIANLGAMVGPIVTGILIDVYGISYAFLSIGVMIGILACMFLFLSKKKFLFLKI